MSSSFQFNTVNNLSGEMPYTHTYLGPGYKVEREGVTSYTFGIISLEEEYYKTPKSYYENLVVVEDSEGTRGFVMRYAIETDEPIEWEPVFGKNIQSYPCGYVSITVGIPCPCPDGGHYPGESCKCHTKAYTYTYEQGIPCGAVFVTEDGEKGGGFNIGGTPSGTSGGGYYDPEQSFNPIYMADPDSYSGNLEPVPFTQIPEPKLIDDYTAAKITFIAGILGLSEEAENWLITSGNKASVTALINKLFAKLLSPFYTEESKAAFGEVINFAIENHFSPKAVEFANEVVEAIANNPNVEVDFEDRIINELTGKAKSIYQSLYNNSNSFKEAIQKFDGDFPVSHLRFTINNSLPSGNYGVTLPPSNYVIAIEMSNTQLANISNLGGAVAFTHEVIHAEIFRKMLSAAKKGDLNHNQYTTEERVNYVNSLRDNFPGLYDYYWERYQPTWNHDMMAEHYIEVIADVVEEFDNNQHSRQIYEDIAWAGLRNLENMNNSIAWSNLSPSDQQRILNNISQYFF